MRLTSKLNQNSKKDELTRDTNGMIKVKIIAPPVEGKANKYLIAYLAEFFGIFKSKVILLRGETTQYKTVEIKVDGINMQKRLEEKLKDISQEF